VDRELLVSHRHGLELDGNGSTFRRVAQTAPELRRPNSNPHWTFRHDTDVTIHDMQVVGLNSGDGLGDLLFEYAYGFFDVDGLVMRNVSADNVFGDGALIGGEGADVCVRRSSILNVSVNGAGRQGIALVCADGAVLKGIHLQRVGAVGIDLEPNGATSYVRNIEIAQSEIDARVLAFAALGAQDVSNVAIHDNVVRAQNRSYPWISVVSPPSQRLRRNWSVLRNAVLQPRSSNSMLFSGVDGADVGDNRAPTGPSSVGVELRGTVGAHIHGNDFGAAKATYHANSACGPVVSDGNTPQRAG
jgi:hypothetical protein